MNKRILEGGCVDNFGVLDDDDFLMVIFLDEWMRLDVGVVDEDDGNVMVLVVVYYVVYGDIVFS